MPQPLIQLGGEKNAPLMSLAPANGFVPETYIPMLRPLMTDYHVVSTPPKALWGEGEAPEPSVAYSWYDLSVDMLAAYEKFGLRDVIAIGHSIGGIMTILTAIQRPDLFKAIILLDPVIVPPERCDYMIQQREQGELPHFSLAAGAKRRRRQFDSVDAAFENFHGKSVFAEWSDEVLRLYVEHGTIDCEGQRCLAWSPDWEAFYYSTYYPYIWQDLPKLSALEIPMLLIGAGNSDTFFPETAQQVHTIIPHATFQTIQGEGHLFPQSAPQATAAMTQTWLAKQ